MISVLYHLSVFLKLLFQKARDILFKYERNGKLWNFPLKRMVGLFKL
jgi:hypothetical protein